MEIISKPLPGTLPDPLYPDSDAENVGESDLHVEALILLREALRDYFSEAPNVYVASDMFWYWEKGNPKACTAPDGLVAKGVVGKHHRKSFREWEEGTRPCVIIEVVSERTWKEDVKEKRDLYASLGVAEYFLFDPEGGFLEPAVQGYRYRDGHYESIVPDGNGCLSSEELGLRLCREGNLPRFRDLRTNRRVLTKDEKLEQANRRAELEARKRRAEAKRAEKNQERAEENQKLAEKNQRRAEQERQRADALQAELVRLRDSLSEKNKPEET
jgi:Uma2 family endonuclease